MDWNHDPFTHALFCEDVVAPFDPGKNPPLAFDGRGKIFPRDLFQIAISKTWDPLSLSSATSPASNHSSIASKRFC